MIGLVACIFTTWVTLYRQGFTNQEALLVGLGVALAAPLGDLFESFLKRDLGVKDSGHAAGGATAACSTASTPCSSRGRPRSPSSRCSARRNERQT